MNVYNMLFYLEPVFVFFISNFKSYQLFLHKKKSVIRYFQVLDEKFYTIIPFLLSETQIFNLPANILEILRDTLHIFCNRQFIHI